MSQRTRVARLTIAFLVLTLSASLGADTYPRQPGVDAVHYVFRLAMGDQSDAITGEATITVKFLQDGLGARAFRSWKGRGATTPRRSRWRSRSRRARPPIRSG